MTMRKWTHTLAGALLAGWYLMLPPLARDGQSGYAVLADAPLSKWIVNASFEQAADCNELQLSFMNNGGKKARSSMPHTFK